jgi:hypothetical protein
MLHESFTDDGKTLNPRRTAILAYEFWRARGCPEGSPEQDWFAAEEQLRHQQEFRHQKAA